MGMYYLAVIFRSFYENARRMIPIYLIFIDGASYSNRVFVDYIGPFGTLLIN